MIRYFIEECKLTFRDEPCPEMLFIDPVDTPKISRECRACISRWRYRDFSGFFSAPALPGKNRSMAMVTPVQLDLPQERRAHLL
jgi:hypothetical protein